MIKNEKSLVGMMQGQGSMVATITKEKSLVGELDKPTTAAAYTGNYSITPTGEEQTIHCGGV